MDGLDANLVSTGLDPGGRRWVVRGAPVGAVVSVGGRPRSGARLDLATPSADAVAPRCVVFGLCGGCQLQEMPLARQRAEKHRALATLLGSLGGVDHGIVGDETGGDDAGYAWRAELATGAFDDVVVQGVPPGGPRMRARPDGPVDAVAIAPTRVCFASFDLVSCLPR